MRLLLLLIIAGVAAYFTVPQRAAHEEAAAAFLEGREPGEARGAGGVTLDSVIGYVKGMLAGEGRYENYYLASKFTLDTPGAAYVECWGAFTQVQCREVTPGG
ncbi:MAG: hypothetical protein NVV62_17595 [Terricaulis sp.]|nr:hypothetical protein [Terricaulis sp.]